MASNKICSVFVADIGKSSGRRRCEGGESFLTESIEILSRMITRKIFADDKDEVGLVLYGSLRTSNTMFTDEEMYENIEVASEVQLPTWELLSKVESLKRSEVKNSDWLEAVVVALDLLRAGSKGKKFKEKQIVLFTNCARYVEWPENKLDTLVQIINSDKINIVVIGCEVEEGAVRKGSGRLLMSLMERVEYGASLSLSEARERVTTFAQKRRNPRKLIINLQIGDHINIPVVWMKITSEKRKLSWRKVETGKTVEGEGRRGEEGQGGEPMEEELTTDNFKYNFITDDRKIVKFMHQEMTLNYADLEALKRESGPPCFTLIGVSKKDFVIPLLYQCSELYMVRAKGKSEASRGMVSALVEALEKSNRVGIARRIQMKNGRVYLGALIGGFDSYGPHFHFLRLPTAEWIRPIPSSIPLHSTQDIEAMQLIDTFIDTMTLPPDIIGPDHKLKLSPNPSVQHRCHLVMERALGRLAKEDKGEVPDFIKEIIEPFPELTEKASPIIAEINKLFPKKEPPEAKLKRKKNPFKTPRDNDLAGSPVKESEGRDVGEEVEGERWKRFKEEVSQEIAGQVKMANQMIKIDDEDTQPPPDTQDILDRYL